MSPPNELAQIDDAIILRRPRSIRRIYTHFRLDHFGVSPAAFHRYARHIRARAAPIDVALRTLPHCEPLLPLIPSLAGQRFLEALVNPRVNSRVLDRCARAYRIASDLEIARRRARSHRPPRPAVTPAQIEQIMQSLAAQRAATPPDCAPHDPPNSAPTAQPEPPPQALNPPADSLPLSQEVLP